MDMSFWTGSVGAATAQKKLDVVSNNLANINNTGYKPKEAVFSELVNYNLNAGRDERTELQAGAGAIVSATNTNFTTAALTTTNRMMDYALTDDRTFFRIQDIATGEITLSRDGHFHAGEMADGRFALMNSSNALVLNTNGEPTILSNVTGADDGELADGQEIGVVTVPFPSRLQSAGENSFAVRAEDTNNPITLVTDAGLVQGALESSGTDMAKEMTNMIEAQRAFSYNVRMITTADEVMSTINQLRG